MNANVNINVNANTNTTGTKYLLDNAGQQAPARLAALAALFDARSIRHLEARGVGPGWKCLEVGGGGGSIASWLADRVGPTGRVLVTDIDPRHLDAVEGAGRSGRTNVDVQRHDILEDPLQDAAFDLIHARLVLLHLSSDVEVLLRKLWSALKPGGWLVDEEFDSLSVAPDPVISPGEVMLPTQLAVARMMVDRGWDRRFGRLLFGRFRAQGFTSVGAEAHGVIVTAGSPWTTLIRANCEQLREAMQDAGYITAEDVDRDLARLDDPAFMMPSSMMWTVWGQRS
jgi:SAM-dependent methyltransferase